MTVPSTERMAAARRRAEKAKATVAAPQLWLLAADIEFLLGIVCQLETQLRNSQQCALRELEAQIRADEAEAERDAATAHAGDLQGQLDKARAALAENAAEYDREIASLAPPTTMSREDEEFRDLARAEAAEARRCLDLFDQALGLGGEATDE